MGRWPATAPSPARVRRVLEFLKRPELHPIGARYVAGAPDRFCLVDVLMSARGGHRNAANL